MTNEPSNVFGSAERDLRRAEHGVEQLLGDDRAADRGQYLLQVLAVDGLDDQTLEHPAEGAADQRRDDGREDEDREVQGKRIGARPARKRRQHQGRGVGAERDEGAVAEIEHVHHAEDERQARGHGEDHHPHREPGGGQRHEGRGRADERRGDEGDGERRQRRQNVQPPARQGGADVERAH